MVAVKGRDKVKAWKRAMLDVSADVLGGINYGEGTCTTWDEHREEHGEADEDERPHTLYTTICEGATRVRDHLIAVAEEHEEAVAASADRVTAADLDEQVERRSVEAMTGHLARGLGHAFWRSVVRPFVEREVRLAAEVTALRATLRTIDVELDHAGAPTGPEDGSGIYTADGRVIALGLALSGLRAERDSHVCATTADADLEALRATTRALLGYLGRFKSYEVAPGDVIGFCNAVLSVHAELAKP